MCVREKQKATTVLARMRFRSRRPAQVYPSRHDSCIVKALSRTHRHSVTAPRLHTPSYRHTNVKLAGINPHTFPWHSNLLRCTCTHLVSKANIISHRTQEPDHSLPHKTHKPKHHALGLCIGKNLVIRYRGCNTIYCDTLQYCKQGDILGYFLFY